MEMKMWDIVLKIIYFFVYMRVPVCMKWKPETGTDSPELE